jgi:hypothetical protein
MTAIAGAKQSRELVEREADDERVLNHPDAVERLGRIHPVAVLEPPRLREETFPLVVAQRV